MSIRVFLCALYVLGFSIYARRNWFVSLCALVLLMAFDQHPDMPRNIARIQGLNLWNILLFFVLIAWWFQRKNEGLVWDMPAYVHVLLLLYFLIVMVSFLRFFANPGGWGEATVGFVVSEYFVNCVKWVVPGFLFFDACRTRKRVLIALVSALAMYLLLALQVIKHVPLSYAASSAFAGEASKQVQNSVGYNRVTLSMMLGGASWAILATLVLVEKRRHKLAVLGAAAVVALGQALTGGRTGYVSWGVVGLILCLVRWRRLLPVIPITVTLVLIFLPSVRDRMLQGFGGTKGNIITYDNDYQITSGRTIAWPYVINKIYKSPVVGYGREAMTTTGIYQKILDEYPEEYFAHPHNAYLEILLDNGIIGFMGVIPFYLVALWQGFRLLLDRQDKLSGAVGGVACSIILALLVGAMGGQTFYPREGSVGMWAAIGLMFRLSVQRKHSLETGEPLFEEDGNRTAEVEVIEAEEPVGALR